MCILKITSKQRSFKNFAKSTDLPIYSCYDKGEYRNETTKELYEEYRLSLDVSDKEWDDFLGQIEDSIEFLNKNYEELHNLILDTDDAYLDFAIYSRLDKDIVNQNDHIPKELIRLAGQLNLGIEMSVYSTNAFE